MLLAGRCAPPDFVEEIHDQRHMTLGFSRLRALSRHQHDEALAVGGEIEIRSQAEVRKLPRGLSATNVPPFTM